MHISEVSYVKFIKKILLSRKVNYNKTAEQASLNPSDIV